VGAAIAGGSPRHEPRKGSENAQRRHPHGLIVNTDKAGSGSCQSINLFNGDKLWKK